MLFRRHLLTHTTGLLAAALVLQAGSCANSAITPAALVSDANNAAAALANMLTQVAKQYPTLIPAATVATLSNDLTLAQQSAQSLSANMPADKGASTLKIVEGYLNAVLNTLAGPPINGLIPAPFNMIVAAAALVVPEIEAFVGQYIPAAAASPATHAARLRLAAGAPAMSLDQARAVLAAAR